MTKNINYVSHKKSKLKTNDGKPQLPSASALVEGEIAINFGKDVETLSIKNESGDVVTFSSDNYYAEKKLGSGFTSSNSARTVTEALTAISGTVTGHTSNTNIHLTTTEKTNIDSLAANIKAISGITSTKVSNWDNAASNSHSHTNKGVIDTISQGDIDNWNSKTSTSGTVTSVQISLPTGLSASTTAITTSGKFNINYSNGYGIPTTAKQNQWDTAYANNHTHSNKTALDSITGSVGTMAYKAANSYSSATQVNTALGNKVDKVTGKGLSTNDYTTEEKNKLAGIAAGAEVNVQSDWNATSGDAFIKNKPTIPSEVTESTVSGWGFTKNTGTITGIKMNGSSKGTSGVVDLGTVITAHQDISGKVDKTTTVNGHALSGNVSVTKSDVGLGNVDNTADANKTVKAATSAATADTAKAVALSNVTSADDLKAIEALTGTSGLLKKTAANTWAMDTTSYSTTAVAVTGATYNSTSKKIEFKNAAGTVVSSVDATAFIKDGMVSNVEVKDVASSGTCLVITFNTDAGKDAINIPISQIFDANNYYTKADLTGSSTTVVVAKASSATTAASASSVPLSGVNGADDLKTIEALTGTSGLLKKTAANTWALDTTSYSSATQVNTALAGKSNTSHTHDGTYAKSTFSRVTVGSTNIDADTTGDTLTLSGSNVTLTPDATNDKLTIGITKSNVTTALGYTPPTTDTNYYATGLTVATATTANTLTISGTNSAVKGSGVISAATTTAAGLMSADDKTKLNGIAAGAEVNVQSDWNATSGDAFIKNKPTIPDSFQWFGTSSTAAATLQKEVSIPSITSLKAGQIIVVKPTVTSTVADSTLKLNSFDAYPMRYNNTAITTSTDSIVWAANIPSLFVFDGSYWIFLGHGLDSNTTYSTMSVAEGTAGTNTSARTMRADYLKQIIQAWAPQSDWNATSGNAVILNKPTIPSEVTESTVSGWGFTKNAGTITGIKMNGASKGTSGVVDLGTVITAHQDISGKVDKTTTVNGHALSGNVSVTKSDVGLGNVGNFKAVSTVASQGLTDTEKSNARANIGAGTSSFSGSYNDLSNKPTIPAAAANGTYTVKTLVGSTTTNVSDFTANQSSADDVTFVQGSNVTITPDATNRKITIAAKDTTYNVVSTSANGLAPKVTDTSKFLKGDGTWATPTDTNNRRSFYGTCDTDAATAAKDVTLSDTTGWELKAGTIVGIKFTNTNSASNVTLNVNSSGAKSIWYNNAAYTSSSNSICGYASRVTYYMYDGTHWVWLNMGNLDGNTNVKQTVTTTANDYEVLFSYTADNTTRTEGARKNSNLKFNPSTGNLQATQLNGVTIGSSPKFTDTDTKVTSVGNHYTPSATSADTKSATASSTSELNWGSSVVTGVTLSGDAKGHITSVTVASGKLKTPVTAITPSNSGSTDPIATKVVAENELTVSNALNDLNGAIDDLSGQSETVAASLNDLNGAIDDLSGQSETVAASLNDLNTIITAHTADTSIHVTQALLDKIADLEDKAIYNGHEYVEIGGLKWATMNIGASKVTDYGLYYAWGEIEGTAKPVSAEISVSSNTKTFSWNDYKYGNGTSSPGASGMTRYFSGDSLTQLDIVDDAARANWGGQWRMPTTDEYAALGDAVNSAWTADYQGTGVKGLICTDKTDSSKVLFFPACGSCADGSVNDVGSYGRYWSSSRVGPYANSAYGLLFRNVSVTWKYTNARFNGYPVRGVVG